jgi:hypothetical protein
MSTMNEFAKGQLVQSKRVDELVAGDWWPYVRCAALDAETTGPGARRVISVRHVGAGIYRVETGGGERAFHVHGGELVKVYETELPEEAPMNDR